MSEGDLKKMPINKNLRQAAYKIVAEAMMREPNPRSVAKHIEGLSPEEVAQVSEWSEHIRTNILDDLVNLWWEP